MKKENKTKTNKKIDIIRWLSILPIAYAESWLCWWMARIIDKEYRTYYSRAYEISSVGGSLYNFIELMLVCVVPFVMVFFTTRFVAPKYKNTVAVITTIAIFIWAVYLLFLGLSHMAY